MQLLAHLKNRSAHNVLMIPESFRFRHCGKLSVHLPNRRDLVQLLAHLQDGSVENELMVYEVASREV